MAVLLPVRIGQEVHHFILLSVGRHAHVIREPHDPKRIDKVFGRLAFEAKGFLADLLLDERKAVARFSLLLVLVIGLPQLRADIEHVAVAVRVDYIPAVIFLIVGRPVFQPDVTRKIIHDVEHLGIPCFDTVRQFGIVPARSQRPGKLVRQSGVTVLDNVEIGTADNMKIGSGIRRDIPV